MSATVATRSVGADAQDGLLALSVPRSPSPATPSVAAVRIHDELDEQPTVVQLGAVTSRGKTAVIGHDNQQLVFHHDSPLPHSASPTLSNSSQLALPALHLGSSPAVSPAYDWKLLPSRPLPPPPLTTTAAVPPAPSSPVAPSAVDVASSLTPDSSHRSHAYISAARSSFHSSSQAGLDSPNSTAHTSQSPSSAPPTLGSNTATSQTPHSQPHQPHHPHHHHHHYQQQQQHQQQHQQHSNHSPIPSPLVSASSLSSLHPTTLPSTGSLAQLSPSRAISAPPVAPLAHSRYSILGLPRPRRLAPVSPIIAAQAAVFHQPPLSLSPVDRRAARPSSSANSGPATAASQRTQSHPRKSWDMREVWVLREQEELRKEEEKQQARVKQLTKALNLCRLFPPPASPLSSPQVESIVKQLDIDLAHLDVGHITSMEREELMLDSPHTVLAVLQLLSSPALPLSAVKEQLADLHVGADISEYVMFFFVEAPATFDHASRAYSRSRSRQSVRTPQLTVSTISPPSRHGRRTSPRNLLPALTSYINRRQSEDKVKEDQVAQYATHVGFDINKVNLSEAERMLGASKDVNEQRTSEAPATAAVSSSSTSQQQAHDGQHASASPHSLTNNVTSSSTSSSTGPPPLHSAKQVVLALQMLYEPIVYDDEHVLSLCKQAGMAAETTVFMMRKNREKREAQLEQDRRERRRRKKLQSVSSATAAAANSSVAAAPPPPRHWPVTVDDVSNMISSHRLCRGWVSDPDELRSLVRITPLDLSRISPIMLEELLAADLSFDSPQQVVRALSLLYADLSQDEVKAECKRSGLSHNAEEYILKHRQVYEELELEELTAEDVKVEAIRQQRRKKQAKIKALNMLQYDIVQAAADEEEIVRQPPRPKQITISQLTDSVRSSQLFDRELLITEEELTALLDEHPFPLSTVDLRQLSSMKDRGLSFSSPVQLVTALELLHADMDDDAVQIECSRRGISPSVAQYVIQHDRPIHAEMMISRENSKAHRRSGGHHINRRSLSLVDTLGNGQELVEEYVGGNTIADIIGGSTTPQQLASAIRQAKLLTMDESMEEERLVQVAQALEFDLSVVDLEMIPILSQHASTFSSVPQLLTALQLLYTDVSDAEIRSECEEVSMDRKTTKFLVKNSLRKLLKSEHVTKQLEGGWLESAEDGEIIVGRPGSGDKKKGWSDPRYARVVYAGDDDLGLEQLVEVSGEQGERTKLDMRLLLQLLQLCSLLDLGCADASAPVHVQEERMQSACSALSFDLSRADKETCLAMYAADCRFVSLKQLVQCFVALYSDISSDEIRAFCDGVKPSFSRQVVDFIAIHSLRQRRRRAQEQRAKQLSSADSNASDGSSSSSSGTGDEVSSMPTSGWFSSSAQLSQLIDQFQLLSPSGCSSSDMQAALAACGLSLADVRLADLAKLAEENITFSTAAQLVQTLSLLGKLGRADVIREEAVQMGLPAHIVRYIDQHREEHLSFAERGRKKQIRQRHQIRYISHELRQDDDDMSRDELAVPQAQRQRQTARALFAKIVSQKSDLLVEQVMVDEEELNEWLVHLPPGVSELNVECVDLIADQLRVDIAGEGKRRYGNVKDVLQSVIDLTFEVAELAEEEHVSVNDMVALMKAGQRQVPAVIVNSSPESESVQSAQSTSPRARLTPVPFQSTGSHARVSSMPNSRRNSGSIHALQHQHSAPVLSHNSAHPASQSGSPSPSPTASALKGDRRHRRGAHSVSWNAKSREVAAVGADKREAQIRELKRMIWQNGLVMVQQEHERTLSAPAEPPSPEPPPLLSQRKSQPTSPQSSSQRLAERDRGHTVPAVPATSPSSTQHSRLLPPPVPPGYLKVNTGTSPSTPSFSAAPVVSPTTPLPPPLPPTVAAAVAAATVAPILVPAPVVVLDEMYNWDLIVDPVYSIHLICELLKWRAVQQPELYFSSPSLLFDFLHDPDCPVFDEDVDALDTRRTQAMELTDTDANGDRDRDNTLTLTGYDERDRSTLHTRTMSGSLRAQRQARQQHISITAKGTPPPLPPSAAASHPQQSASSASSSTTASISPSDSNAAPPPPLPPTAFPTPPFSPAVLLTINHPFVYPPTVDAVSNQRRAQRVDHDIASMQQHNGAPGQPAQDESAVGCCGMRKGKGESGCVIL